MSKMYIGNSDGTPKTISKLYIGTLDGEAKSVQKMYIGTSSGVPKLCYESTPSPSVKIVSWSNGTDEEIAAMLEAHYNGEINVSDYWNIGDKRKIHINSMVASWVTDSHHADDYDFVILGFNHDTLSTPINGITTAAITIQTERILYKNTTTTTYTTDYPSVSEEGGYMNSSNTNSGGWNSCARRNWCNSVFVKALPDWIQSNIKLVKKNASAGNKSSIITTSVDSCFLLAEAEVFATRTYARDGEGTQYEYYKDKSKVCKLPVYKTYSSALWWLRSPRSNNSTGFCRIVATGDGNYFDANYPTGIAPAFCL